MMGVPRKEKEDMVLAYLCGGRAYFGIEGTVQLPVTYEPRSDRDRNPWVDETGRRLPYSLVRVYPKEANSGGQTGEVSR